MSLYRQGASQSLVRAYERSRDLIDRVNGAVDDYNDAARTWRMIGGGILVVSILGLVLDSRRRR